jgi:hypothetical protein
MPRTIKADGRTITVPDDATPDEINQIVGPAPAPPSTDPSGRTASGEAAASDTRNGFQRTLDNLITPDPRREEWQSPIRSGVDDFAQHVAKNVVPLISHPIASAEGMVRSLLHPENTAKTLVRGVASDYEQHGPIRGTTDLLGTGAGLAATSELGGAGGRLLTDSAHAVSAPMRAGGGGLVEHAAGALKSDFAHGAQPGEAYLEGGGTPALTMRGLANKAEAVKSNAGQQLGTAYDNATASGVKIPSADVSDAVLTPANRLRAIQNAPGGTGETPLLDAYESHAEPYLSSQPEFTPREAFGLKRNIADNTRWNDPTMFDMNSVRQQGVGGIGKLLTDAVPETAPLNRIYQGAGNLAERAGTRADTGTPPFTSLVNRGLEGAAGLGLGYATHNPFLAAAPLLMDSVPVKTATGYLLYHGGRAAAAVPNLGMPGAVAGATAPLLQGAQ